MIFLMLSLTIDFFMPWKQEVDLCSFTSNTFYSGIRKLLGKQTIYSIQIHDGLLFAGGSSVDATAGKVCKNATRVLIIQN